MNLKIDFYNPIIKEDDILKITPEDLDNFYINSNDFDKFNLFFIILTSIYHYSDKKNSIITAHLYFLAAYYIFTPLTPPGSYELAVYYIKKAIELNDCAEYRDWQTIIINGN